MSFQQIGGITIGIKCAPLVADLYLYSCHPDYKQGLMRQCEKKLALYLYFDQEQNSATIEMISTFPLLMFLFICSKIPTEPTYEIYSLAVRQEQYKAYIYKQWRDALILVNTFQCHWPSRNSWVWKKIAVFCNACNLHTLSPNIWWTFLMFRWHSSLQKRYPPFSSAMPFVL